MSTEIKEAENKKNTHIVVPLFLHKRLKSISKRTGKRLDLVTKDVILSGLSKSETK